MQPQFQTASEEDSSLIGQSPEYGSGSSMTDETCYMPLQVSRILMKRYDRSEIYRLVWSVPMKRAQEILGLAELRNICDRLHIPHPPAGYWQKRAVNKYVDAAPPLPSVQISETGQIVDANVQLEVPRLNSSQISSDKFHLASIEPLTDSCELPVCGDASSNHASADSLAANSDSEQGVPKVLASLMSRYSRDQLYEEVWTDPLWTLAKKYGISDVGLAKVCRKLHIPLPPPGYWAKQAAKKPVAARPMLPAVEVVQKFPRRTGKVHAPEEIKAILQGIQESVSKGITVNEACQRTGISVATFLRWRKL